MKCHTSASVVQVQMNISVRSVQGSNVADVYHLNGVLKSQDIKKREMFVPLVCKVGTVFLKSLNRELSNLERDLPL
jgi:hypothetical protein